MSSDILLSIAGIYFQLMRYHPCWDPSRNIHVWGKKGDEVSLISKAVLWKNHMRIRPHWVSRELAERCRWCRWWAPPCHLIWPYLPVRSTPAPCYTNNSRSHEEWQEGLVIDSILKYNEDGCPFHWSSSMKLISYSHKGRFSGVCRIEDRLVRILKVVLGEI